MPGKRFSFAEALLSWFDQFGRHGLPWQTDKTPYRVWLSEIMLQQTQVATVIPYYQRFLNHFPDIDSLANADIDQVLQHWQGLGYYARARNLHRAAQIIRDEHRGSFPQDIEDVLALPGIGRSTAAAILTFACGQNWPILDGNVKRVLARYFQVEGWYGQSETMKQLWQHSESVTPSLRTDDFNQAMMDLGSMVCVKSKPLCDRCPITAECLSFQHQTQGLYPHKKPRKDKPHKQTLMLLYRFQDQVLMYRRPPNGIWGGLWSLPEVDREGDIENWQQRHLSAKASTLSICENLIRHQFTHFSLDISVANIDLKQLPQLVSEDNLEFLSMRRLQDYGLPTPVRKILEQSISGFVAS